MGLAKNSLEMRIEELGQELEQSKEDQEGLAKSVCNKDEDIASWKLKAVRIIINNHCITQYAFVSKAEFSYTPSPFRTSTKQRPTT